MPPAFNIAAVTRRIVAFGFDWLLIIGYAVVLGVAVFALVTLLNILGRPVAWPADPIQADILAFVTLVLPVILYFTLQESSPRQATWGKRRAGLRVTTVEGGRLSRKQAFVRSFLKFLPWQVAHTSIFHIEGWPTAPAEPTSLVMVGFLLVWVLVIAYVGSMLLLKSHRALYDLAAGTCVIATR